MSKDRPRLLMPTPTLPDIVAKRTVNALLKGDKVADLEDLHTTILYLHRCNEDQARFIEGCRKQEEKRDTRQGKLLLGSMK